MGQLLKVGQGNISVDEFENYLISKQTPAFITPAHPQGLYLSRVLYPFLDLPPRSSLASIVENNDEKLWRPV